MLVIWTMNHEYYKVNNKNQIIRTDMPMDFHDSWKFLGVLRVGPFGKTGMLIPPEKVLEIKDWLFKNGKSRYRLMDLDHGTRRIWGQGIREIYAK